MHRALTRQAVSTDENRGIPTGWTYADGSKSTYGQSFWLMPFEGRGGCRMRVPAMAGFGGNYVVLMPNRVIGFGMLVEIDQNSDTQFLATRQTGKIASENATGMLTTELDPLFRDEEEDPHFTELWQEHIGFEGPLLAPVLVR